MQPELSIVDAPAADFDTYSPGLSVARDEARPYEVTLDWALLPAGAEAVEYLLDIEEESTGYMRTWKNPAPPFNATAELPEAHFNARLRAFRKTVPATPPKVSALVRFDTLRESYFEDRNPRPDHILSMDEGNKFGHSRMFRILNVAPGQHLPRFPQLRWVTTIPHITSFDIAFFNKDKAYWVFLRNIRNTNAIPGHALEPGAWFVFVKGTRDLGQVWSFPCPVVVDEAAEQEQDVDIIVRPGYMDSEGEYFTPETIVRHDRAGNRASLDDRAWYFRPAADDGLTVVGIRPRFSWMAVPGAASYEIYFESADPSAGGKRFDRTTETAYAVAEPLAPGRYNLVVHALSVDSDGVGRRRLRSARLDFEVAEHPFKANYLAMEKALLSKLEREKAFAEHMDAISGMDFFTNVELKRWEIRNGVTDLLSMPQKLTTLVGYNCNIDCHFCDNGRVPRNIVIPENYIEDLQYFMPYATVMQILGGEPLMLKDFKRIVQLASKFPHLRLATTTNGTLVDDEWAWYFARSNFFQIWMSVDGATEPVYQSMRRGGELKSVVDGVKKIVAYGKQAPAVCWSFIISRRNYHEIVDYYRLARDLGVKAIFYKMLQLRFGPNYPGVGRLDALMDRDICDRVMRDLATVRNMARDDGIVFDERVVSYVRHVHPGLVEEYFGSALPDKEISDAEAEGADEMYTVGSFKRLPEPVKGDPAGQRAVLDRLTAFHKDRGNDRFEGIELDPDSADELCQLPFSHLGLNGTNAYMCCYGTRDVLPISFEPEHLHLTDVWNSPRYQFSRESFYRRRVGDACLPTCPYLKGKDKLWNTWMLDEF